MTFHDSFQVPWRTVLSGIFLQFLFGLFVLRRQKGFLAAEFLGNQTIVFLEYTKAGSKFVFGDPYWKMHELVMMVCEYLKPETANIMIYVDILSMTEDNTILEKPLCKTLHSGKKIMKQGRGYNMNVMCSKTYIDKTYHMRYISYLYSMYKT